MLRLRNRIGILSIYHPLCCLTVSLPELTDLRGGIEDLYAGCHEGFQHSNQGCFFSGAAQDFMISNTTKGLSQAGHSLDLVFCFRQEKRNCVQCTSQFVWRNYKDTKTLQGWKNLKMIAPRSGCIWIAFWWFYGISLFIWLVLGMYILKKMFVFI